MGTVDDILQTGSLAVEFRIKRYEVDWPVGGGNSYVAPPWEAGSEPSLINEQNITAWVQSYAIQQDDDFMADAATLRLVGDYQERIDRGTAFTSTVDAIGATYIDVADSMGATDYAGYFAVITSGAANGETFYVDSNTTTRLTIDGKAPNAGPIAAGDGIKVSEMTALRAMDVVLIEENWRSADGSLETGMQRVWQGMVDNVKERFGRRGRYYVVNCRDAMKLTDLDLLDTNIEPDKILVDRKALTLHAADGGDPSDPVRIYGDGAEGSHTTNWAPAPAPKVWAVWDDASELRLRHRESIDVVEGDGRVRISVDYWEEGWPDGLTKGGGVGVPTSIEAEYHRYAQAADVATETATASSATTITVSNGMASDEHKGKTVIVRSGGAANKRYTVVSNTATVLTVSGGDPDADGVAADDSIQVGDPNRGEDAIRRIALLAGFQDQQSGEPFYIQEIAAPSPGPVYIPPVTHDEINDRRSHMEALQDVLRFMPPNYQLYTDSQMRLHGEQVTQGAVDWTVDVYESADVLTSDRDVYTRVIALGEEALQYNLFARQHGTTINWYASIAEEYRARCPNLAEVIDGDALTPRFTNDRRGFVAWYFGGNDEDQWFTGKHVFYIDMGADYSISEIHLIAPEAPYTRLYNLQILSLWVGTAAAVASPSSYDDAAPATGGWTQLTNELSPVGGMRLSYNDFLTQAPATFRYLKVFCDQEYFWHANESRHAVILTELQGYNTPVIEGEAVLGVTSPFDAAAYLVLMNRYRRRTFVVPESNPYLDTAAKANAMALSWLQERYRDFSPRNYKGVRPDASIRQTVNAPDLVTGREVPHLVKALQHNSDGTITCVLVHYA